MTRYAPFYGLSKYLTQIWSTTALAPVYVLHPYLETGAGDLFSLIWSSSLQTVYIGCQNTSLQWFDFSKTPIGFDICSITGSPSSTDLGRRPHKFFDSYPRYARRPADIFANNGLITPPTSYPEGDDSVGVTPSGASLQIPATNVIDSAHFGYVYCLALLPPRQVDSDDEAVPVTEDVQLVSGSGDETVKVRLRRFHFYSCTF
jgi:di- and tripeptidase